MYRILVVDDEPEVVRALRRLLRREGFIAACAHSGPEALALMADFAPHLVLTDFRMPAMSGTELLRMVAKRSPHTMGVMLSGNADLASASRDDEAVILEKPWEDDALCTRLRQLLERSRPSLSAVPAN